MPLHTITVTLRIPRTIWATWESGGPLRALLHAQPWWPPGAVEQGAWRIDPVTQAYVIELALPVEVPED